MDTALYSIQKRVIEILRQDSKLNELVVGVFDEIPQKEKYPIIMVGDPQEDRFETFDRMGKDVIFPLQIFSKHKGFKECYLILDRVNALLHYQEIKIDGFDTVYFRVDNVNGVRTERDFRQLIANYQVLVQQSKPLQLQGFIKEQAVITSNMSII